MKLKSFGCSLIFGSDLADVRARGILSPPSQYTWPALLSKAHGYDYISYARPGVGNLYILEKILIQSTIDEPSLFVVNWTYIDRFDHTNAVDEWNTIIPGEKSDRSTFYYKNLHSTYRDKLVSLMAIKTALDCLKSNNHKFIFTYADNLLWETNWHHSKAIDGLQQATKPYFASFQGKTFLDWANDNQYLISDTMHPLEPAHKAAADLVLANWDRWIKS